MPKITRNSVSSFDGNPIMDEMPGDFEAIVSTFNWIDFLLHRVRREKLANLMNYYEEIGWISRKAKSQILSIARGTVQDTSNFEDVKQEVEKMDDGLAYHNIQDYRLSASDHVKSLVMIMKIIGEPVDNYEEMALEEGMADRIL